MNDLGKLIIAGQKKPVHKLEIKKTYLYQLFMLCYSDNRLNTFSGMWIMISMMYRQKNGT